MKDERDQALQRLVGKRIFVGLFNRPGNPTERYCLEGDVTDVRREVIPNTDLSNELWLTNGYYCDLDNGERRIEFRPGNREKITLTDWEVDRIIFPDLL